MTRQAQANPAVTSFQTTLVYLHDTLRKLYQKLDKQENAIASFQEAIRISELLAQRFPQDTDYTVDITYYTTLLGDYYKLTKRENEAISLQEKLIRQADAMMKLHPKSAVLLGNLVYACKERGQLLFDASQFDKARLSYQAGVDLFARHKGRIEAATEQLRMNYFHCCRGLLLIAKEAKELKTGIEIANKLTVPMNIEDFSTSDNKQQLIGEWRTLSVLNEDAGNVEEALRLRERAVEASRKILGGDNKSNWYAYQQVFGSHPYLARLYRQAGKEQKEFDALRDFLRETEPYVCERDHSPLLKETERFTPANLARLRKALDKYMDWGGGMKRFTVPVYFDGVKNPFHVYVADSWQFVEDQFTWVEKPFTGVVASPFP